MKRRSILMSFSSAVQGIAQVVRSERNMRIHLCIALLVVVFASAVGVTRLELMALVFAIGLVFTTELFNTAVEEVVDLITPDFHPRAGMIKNITAGGVLAAALTAAAIGYLVFIDYLLRLDELLLRGKMPLPCLVATAVAVVLVFVFGWRGLARRSRPSGHTAVAFALAAAIWETSRGVPVVAGLLLAVVVAHSRLEGGRHSWGEVLTGALLGACLSLLFFQLLA
ncbi:MAG TPA: diacylglycerol kinase [Limnochordia bacterium]|nr:diacylglycerol kinase [Limnochordia bacterium]